MNPHSHLQKGAAPGGGAPAVVLTGTIASAPPTAAGARTFEDRDDGHAVAHILQPPEDKQLLYNLGGVRAPCGHVYFI